MSQHEITNTVFGIADAFAKLARTPKVYPAYIASRIKAALLAEDPKAPKPLEHIIEGVGDIETLGSSRYSMTVTDHNGTAYRVTVQVSA